MINIAPVLPDGRGNSLSDITQSTITPAVPGTGTVAPIIPEGTPEEIAEVLRQIRGNEIPTTDKTLNCGSPDRPSGGASIRLSDQEYQALHGPMRERFEQLQNADPNAPFPPPPGNERIAEAMEMIDELCRPTTPISLAPTTPGEPHHGLTSQVASKESEGRTV